MLFSRSFYGDTPTTSSYSLNLNSISSPIALSYLTHPLTPSAGMKPLIWVVDWSVTLPLFLRTSLSAISTMASSPEMLNSMKGSIRILDESSKDLVSCEAHLFITDFENEDFLYFPPSIWSWIPTAGSLFFPYKREVLHVSTSSYRVSNGKVFTW